MDPLRKTARILIAILVVEAVPLFFTLTRSPRGVLGRVYGFDPHIWPAWLLALAIAAAYILYAVRRLPLIGARFFDRHWLKLVAILFAIVTGSFEELFFRKMLMDWAARDGASALAQVVFSALVFGIGHAVWGLFGRQWRVAVGAALSTGVLGALLALVYLAAGRQVAPCIWSHLLINLALEPWLILAATTAFQKRGSSPETIA